MASVPDVSAGARHSARLWYFAYQTVVGALKIYAVSHLQLGCKISLLLDVGQ